MPDYEFIIETPNKQKIEVFVFSLMALVVIFAVFFAFFSMFKEGVLNSSSFQGIKGFFSNDIKNLTPAGIFYLSIIGNLVLIPLPVEISFFAGLAKGNPIWISLILVMAGVLPSQAINYVVGTKFSRLVMNILSRKKVYKAKRWVNKYGSYAIFGLNLLPAASNELTFILGLAKYNITRLFVFLILGNIVKFLAIIGFYSLFA